MANEAHTDVFQEVHVPEAGHETGFPPFNAETFASQLIWLAITFGLLYMLLSRVALPRIATVLEERRDRIADDLDQAAQSKAKTDEAIAAYEAALADARAKAHEIAQKTRDELTAETDRQRHEIESELSDKATAAEAEIQASKTAALANVAGVATEVTSAIMSSLLGEDSDKAAVEKAVAASLRRGDA
ncbi:MAG: F0F1 ATP synthase subunit B [Rhizobiales bacterium]|nr:F0F1 ATP synthase subunit B [Hyphomicrobiales bacterium]